MRDRLFARLTWRNAVPITMVSLAVLNGANTLFDGADNAKRIPWEQVGNAAQHPLATFALAAVGIVWLIFFSNVRPERPVAVVHRGVKWRRVDESVRPFCPNHDVRLLARDNESQQTRGLENPVTLGPDRGQLQFWCSGGGGHAIPLLKEVWTSNGGAMEARTLIEQKEGGRASRSRKVVS